MLSFTLLVALKYIKGKAKFLFNINSRLAFIGVFVATSLMVVILSIFDGFQRQIKESIFKFEPHLSVENPLGDGKISDWKKQIRLIDEKLGNKIQSIQGMIQSPALIRVLNQVDYVFLRGQEFKKNDQGKWVLPKDFPPLVYPEKMKSFPQGRYCFIGKEMAINLNLQVGEPIELVVPRGQFSLRMGVKPNIRRFRIAGLFQTGHYEYDSKAILLALPTAQSLFQIGKAAQQISIKINDLDDLDEIQRSVIRLLPFAYQMRTIKDQQKTFFAALALEKLIVTIIVSLFIVAAMTGIVVSTYHTIRSRRKDIGILKAIGVSETQILSIFTLNGFVMGTLGTFFGMLFGVFFTLKLNSLLGGVENTINRVGHFFGKLIEDYHWYDIQIIPANIYYFDHIPIFFDIPSLHTLGALSLILTSVASFIPARYASRLEPIDIIHSS